jgi:hypothetical protein
MGALELVLRDEVLVLTEEALVLKDEALEDEEERDDAEKDDEDSIEEMLEDEDDDELELTLWANAGIAVSPREPTITDAKSFFITKEGGRDTGVYTLVAPLMTQCGAYDLQKPRMIFQVRITAF